MKKLFLLFSLVIACSFYSFAADECCANTEATVQQRLRDIDLNIALKKYEQIQTEKAKAELQLVLLDTELETPQPERTKNLQRRIDILSGHAHEIRAYVLKLSKELSVASK
jgi:hypothetical protein